LLVLFPNQGVPGFGGSLDVAVLRSLCFGSKLQAGWPEAVTLSALERVS